MGTGKNSIFSSYLNEKTFLVSVIALSVSACLYAYGILAAPKSFHSLITILFLAVFFCVFIANLAKVMREPEDAPGCTYGLPVLYAAVVHLALISGFYLAGNPEAALWITDANAVHIPGAVNVANYLHGKEALVSIGNVPFSMVFLTQAYVGLFFSVMGKTPLASFLALMVAKLLTIAVLFRLAKTMFNRKVGVIGALVYVFSPTILYYTTAFYKEAVVQLIISVIMLSALKLFLKPGNWRYWVLLGVSLAAIINERFYLFFFFMAALIPLVLVKAEPGYKKYFAVVFILLACGLYLIVGKYADMVVGGHIDRQGLLAKLFEILRHYRANYTSYPDVTPINLIFPYPLAFIKLLFTPFFTLDKFVLFSEYGYILIWGSFFNQIVILFSLYGMYKSLKGEFGSHWFLICPFVLFLCMFAYVAPYIGRLRDSFYPLISIYAAYAIFVLRASYRGSTLASHRGN